MIKFIILYLLTPLFIVLHAEAQDFESGKVGFSCSFTGTSTFTVKNMTKLALDSNYCEIRKKMINGNTAEKYLSVILCEAFQESNLIILNDEEISTIQRLYNSNRKIAICSGCSITNGKLTIGELLNKNSKFSTTENARRWANTLVKRIELQIKILNGKDQN